MDIRCYPDRQKTITISCSDRSNVKWDLMLLFTLVEPKETLAPLVTIPTN